MANGSVSLATNKPFTRKSFQNFSYVRNGWKTLWTAPEDALVFVSVNFYHNNGGGYMTCTLYHTPVGGSAISVSNQLSYTDGGSMNAILDMKKGDLIQMSTGFSNNAGPCCATFLVCY